MKNVLTESIRLLINTVQELTLTHDLESLMKIVRTAARNLTGADGATFVLREGDKCFYADEDAVTPLWKGRRIPMNTCISGWAMLNRKPVVIEDIYTDDRIPADVYLPTFVKSLVMVPIRTIDPIGAIGNYWASHRKPTEDEIWLLQSLADITAITIENINMYGELENRVKERTRQLEAANQDMETFVYTVSHDLRAPLRIINGYSNMLITEHATSLSEEGKRIITKITTGGRNMATLVDRLLQFYKTQHNELYKIEVSMQALVLEITKEIKQHEPQREIQFIINDLPEVKAYPVLITQVWANLISNAVKYTSQKPKVIIEIGIENNQSQFVYYIKDNGIGFDMQHYNKLFGIFQRLPGAQQFEGSGIGLANVQRIIARHGGNVWAEGIPGEGATFHFSLPK